MPTYKKVSPTGGAFSLPKSRSVLINWNLAGRFVGNAFMHSASVTVSSGHVEWKNVKNEPIAIQRTTESNRRFGTHECVPYAHVGTYPVGRTRQMPIYRIRILETLSDIISEKGAFFNPVTPENISRSFSCRIPPAASGWKSTDRFASPAWRCWPGPGQCRRHGSRRRP